MTSSMTSSHSNPASSIKSYNTEPADMTKKGRFKVRKVKSSTPDDSNKNILKESNKSKIGNVSLSPKQQQQLKHQQLGALGTGKITIYNVSKLFPYSEELGGQYVLLDNPQKTCEENSRLAAQAGRSDLEKMWRVCARIASAVNQENIGSDYLQHHTAWTHHPMGRPMLTSIIDHYVKQLDFQTAAMVTCTFFNQKVTDAEAEDETPVWSKVFTSLLLQDILFIHLSVQY